MLAPPYVMPRTVSTLLSVQSCVHLSNWVMHGARGWLGIPYAIDIIRGFCFDFIVYYVQLGDNILPKRATPSSLILFMDIHLYCIASCLCFLIHLIVMSLPLAFSSLKAASFVKASNL